jgi:hypothetical protein
MDHVISIALDGTVRTLYTDKIDLRDFGTLDVQRASSVEWDNERNGWTVQFPDGYYLARPFRGWCCGVHALLGREPEVFETREEALKAEVDYLQARL